MENASDKRNNSGRWLLLGIVTGLAALVAVILRRFQQHTPDELRQGTTTGAAAGWWSANGKIEAATEPVVAQQPPVVTAAVDLSSVKGDGSIDCPAAFPVKVSRSGIYYAPHQGNYSVTVPKVCFATEEAAAAAGYRPRKA